MRILILSTVLAACGGSGGGGADLSPSPDLMPPAAERGAYLVEHVAGCGDCHTPRAADGTPDRARWLGGWANEFDLDTSDPASGAISAPNLTPDPSGLGGWSDEQIKTAIRDGVDKDGKPLFPIMPYAALHGLSDADADAIVAYLRSLTPVDNTVPDPQPLPWTIVSPENTLDPSLVPHTTLAAADPQFAIAERGRYLASIACLDCHTPFAIDKLPLDATHLLAGGRTFDAASLGLPVPPYPATIVSSNLTPHANGLAGWSAADVAAAIHSGVDNKGAHLCAPMPFGPMGAFAGMTDDDALAIGVYLTTLPPVDNGLIPFCVKAPIS